MMDKEKKAPEEMPKPGGPGDMPDDMADFFSKPPEVPKMSQEEMSLQFDRVSAAIACENLADEISYLYTANKMVQLAGLFAERDDTKILMPYGVYTGKDAAKRCFVDDLVDMDDPDPARAEELKGRMVINDFCSPVVEVAGDCKTARGVWVSPGLEAHPNADRSNAQGYWSWCRFAADFILEDGKWKLWHLCKYMYFASEYEKNWAESPKFIFTPAHLSADAPAPEQYYYSVDAVFPDSEPEPPLPYATWDEVAPGY